MTFSKHKIKIKKNSIKHVNKLNRNLAVYVQNADLFSQLDIISSLMFIDLDFLQGKKWLC